MLRRDLRPFKEPEKLPIPPAVLRRNRALKELVESDGWQYLKAEVLPELLSNYTAPPPMTPTNFVGYATFCIIRDGTAQLVDLVEQHARELPQAEEQG